jgi:hypothetical protein
VEIESEKNEKFVKVNLKNPRKIDVRLTVFHAKDSQTKPIYDAVLSGDTVFQIPALITDSYEILAQYFWNGYNQILRKDVLSREKKLNLAVTQPDKIYPGQSQSVSIKVTDFNDRPAVDVKLTAFSVNSTFTTSNVPDLTAYPTPNNTIAGINEFVQKKYDKNSSLPLSKSAITKYQLDTIELYRLLYPKESIYEVSLNLPNLNALPQFSPYVIENGNAIPIHLIYINDELIYFSGADIKSDYSFEVDTAREYKISLRTHNRQYNFEIANLQKGEKRIIVINAPLFENTTLQTDTLKNLLSASEIRVIQNNLLLLDKNIVTTYYNELEYEYASYLPYIVQGTRKFKIAVKSNYNHYNYHYEDNWSNTKNIKRNVNYLTVGVLNMYRKFDYIHKNQFVRNMSFKPMHVYTELGAQIVAYRVDSIAHLTDTLSAQPFMPNFLENITENSDIQIADTLIAEEQTTPYFSNSNIHIDKINVGTVRFAWEKDIDLSYATLVSYNPDAQTDYRYKNMYSITGNKEVVFYDVPADKYSLILQNKNGTFTVIEPIETKSKGINYFKLALNTPFYKKNSVSRWALLEARDSLKPTAKYQIADSLDFVIAAPQSYGSLLYSQVGNKGNFVRGRVISYEVDSTNVNAVKDKSTEIYGGGLSVSVKPLAITTQTDMFGEFEIYVPYGYDTLTFGNHHFTKKITGSYLEIIISDSLFKILPFTSAINEGALMSAEYAYYDELGSSADESFGGGDMMETTTADASPAPSAMKMASPRTTAVFSKENVEPMPEADNPYAIRQAKVDLKEKLNAPLEIEEMAQQGATNQMRKNFRDYAYWIPALKTNTNGEAAFTAQYPDDITQWNNYILAHDSQLRTGIYRQTTKAYKPLLANLSLPRFIVEGDVANAMAKATNYSLQPLSIKTQFSFNKTAFEAKNETVKTALFDSLTFTAPLLSENDSVKISYSLTMDNGYFDGEERGIAILPRGTEETKGFFLAFEKDTSFQLTFDSDKDEVYFSATADLLDVMLEEINHIKSYEYDCSEQTASKLIANLHAKQILSFKMRYANANTAALQAEIDSADVHIKKGVKRLTEYRNNEGLWGWWRGGSINYFMTAYVYRALVLAKNNDYEVGTVLDEAKRNIAYRLPALSEYNLLDWLSILSEEKEKLDYKSYIAQIVAVKKNKYESVYQDFRIIKIKQEQGLPYSLDEVFKHKKTTIYGSLYFGETKNWYAWYDNATELTLLAYQILKKEGSKYQTELAAIRRYFIERKNNGYWTNTRESAQILTNILPDILAQTTPQDGKIHRPQLVLSGDVKKEIANFPQKQQAIGKVKNITVQKTGAGFVYVSLHQKSWNKAPEKLSKEFTVTTSFTNQKGEAITELKAGEPAVMVVEVKATAKADYVQIEVPIPAGCSYSDTQKPYLYKYGYYNSQETYREEFRHKTAIFAEKLNEGVHKYYIYLQPRFSGNYHLNPAKAQLMYFPTLQGRETMKKTIIK